MNGFFSDSFLMLFLQYELLPLTILKILMNNSMVLALTALEICGIKNPIIFFDEI